MMPYPDEKDSSKITSSQLLTGMLLTVAATVAGRPLMSPLGRAVTTAVGEEAVKKAALFMEPVRAFIGHDAVKMQAVRNGKDAFETLFVSSFNDTFGTNIQTAPSRTPLGIGSGALYKKYVTTPPTRAEAKTQPFSPAAIDALATRTNPVLVSVDIKV